MGRLDVNVIKKMLVAAGTASIALSPIVAAAAAPAANTLASRAAPSSVNDSELDGDNRGLIIGGIAAAAIIVGIIIISGDDDDEPTSP